MGCPTHDTCHGENRCIDFLWQTNHFIDKATVEIKICTRWLAASTVFLQTFDTFLLYQLQEIILVFSTLFLVSLPEVDKLTNIVFMGQGEPMDNLDNVLRATEILTADYGWAWSPKRITVSSVGVKNKLKRFLEESDCHVAISMHDPIPSERAELMPAERGMGIEQVVELLRNYDFSHQRRLSFEYIVFKGVNDSMQHAKAIIKLVKGLDCRFNLIRFHQIPDIPLQGVDDEKMEQFRDYLTQHGVFTTIRASRGQDIYAACGLLSTSKKIGEIREHEDEEKMNK